MKTYKKSHNLLAAATIICLMAGTTTSAAIVTLTDSAPQTSSGQNFAFTFSPVELSDGTDGTFTIHARGDYSYIPSAGISQPEEFLTWNIEGLISHKASPTLPGSMATVIQEYGANDLEWEQSFTVSGSLLETITADSLVKIFIDLESPVNTGWGSPFVETTLSYASVPEPGTLVMLTVSSLGMILRKRR